MEKKLIKWGIYTLIFLLILIPLIGFTIKLISIALVIGFFAAILNEILNK